MTDIEKFSLVEQLIREGEGTGPMKNGRYFIYTDTVGKFTACIGRNITDKGFSEDECRLMLSNDIKETIAWLSKYSFWSYTSENRKAALISMGFNLGPSRFSEFKNMIAALNKRDYATAAKEGLESQWRKQVGKRAHKLLRIIETDQA